MAIKVYDRLAAGPCGEVLEAIRNVKLLLWVS